MLSTTGPRKLFLKEVEAIRRVESRGIQVDYQAITDQLLRNQHLGQPEQPVFSVIYRDYYPRLQPLQNA